jgi:hypothetical protein
MEEDENTVALKETVCPGVPAAGATEMLICAGVTAKDRAETAFPLGFVTCNPHPTTWPEVFSTSIACAVYPGTWFSVASVVRIAVC